MNIKKMMKTEINTAFEIRKDDPIYIWLRDHDCIKEDMDLVAVIKSMPTEMGKEFVRRMITAQAINEKDADIVKKIARLAFTYKEFK